MKEPEVFMIGVAEAAAICGISRSHLYSLLSRGEFPKPRKLGRRRVWPKLDLIEWLRGNGGAAAVGV